MRKLNNISAYCQKTKYMLSCEKYFFTRKFVPAAQIRRLRKGMVIFMKKDTRETAETKQKKSITSKQVVAMAGVVLLVLLYLITLAAAVLDNSASGSLLWMCLFATIAVPILIWLYTWMYGKLTGRKTISDPK